VSRRGEEGPISAFFESPEGDKTKLGVGPPDQMLDVDNEGFTIYLRVNYKVILLIAVIVDIFHTSVNELLVHVFRL